MTKTFRVIKMGRQMSRPHSAHFSRFACVDILFCREEKKREKSYNLYSKESDFTYYFICML